MAKATFDYTAENPDELSLKVGDIVSVSKMDEEGWWEGSLNGKQGVFPSNFVELVDSAPATSKSAPAVPPPAGGARKPQGGVGFGNIFSGGQPKLRSTGTISENSKSEFLKGTSSGASKGKSPQAAMELVKVTFDYTAENDDELTLKVGDFIRIIKKENEGWWEGEFDGNPSKRGWFPDNFVAPATAAEKKERNGAGETSPPKPKSLGGARPPPPGASKPVIPGPGMLRKTSAGGAKPPLPKSNSKPNGLAKAPPISKARVPPAASKSSQRPEKPSVFTSVLDKWSCLLACGCPVCRQ